MALLLRLRPHDHGRSTRNRCFLVSRSAALRLRLNIIEPWTAFAAWVAFRTGAKSRDVAAELAAGVPSVHRGVDFFFWHWNASIKFRVRV
jgi:hypothetical protein